jgi:hypothetical protein
MVACSRWVLMKAGFSGVGDDALGGFQAFVDAGHQRHADAAGAGVWVGWASRASRLPGKTVTLY